MKDVHIHIYIKIKTQATNECSVTLHLLNKCIHWEANVDRHKNASVNPRR